MSQVDLNDPEEQMRFVDHAVARSALASQAARWADNAHAELMQESNEPEHQVAAARWYVAAERYHVATDLFSASVGQLMGTAASERLRVSDCVRALGSYAQMQVAWDGVRAVGTIDPKERVV